MHLFYCILFSVQCKIKFIQTTGLKDDLDIDCILSLNQFFGGFYYVLWILLVIGGIGFFTLSLVFHVIILSSKGFQKCYLKCKYLNKLCLIIQIQYKNRTNQLWLWKAKRFLQVINWLLVNDEKEPLSHFSQMYVHILFQSILSKVEENLVQLFSRCTSRS